MSPLDWGLGHATRCVPLIRDLLKHNQVILGTTPLTEKVLREEFPQLKCIEVPAYDVSYRNKVPIWLTLLLDWPRMRSVIRAENEWIGKIIEEEKVDVVISDNRFGLRSKRAYSVFITHQLFLKAPFAKGIAQRINRSYITKFDEVWVPDFEDVAKSLSGQISHGRHYHPKVKYLGPLSRLERVGGPEIKYDYLLLLSGPEPHHSILANKLLALAATLPETKFAFCSYLIKANGTKNITSVYNPSRGELAQLITQSRVVVCRSGYSTLMDMFMLGKKNLILIPTPGQTEQEYLAEWWAKQFNARICVEVGKNLFSND